VATGPLTLFAPHLFLLSLIACRQLPLAGEILVPVANRHPFDPFHIDILRQD
jgi:hypothetical protein